MVSDQGARRRPLPERAARLWALAGGVVLVAVMAVTGTSIVLDLAIRRPITGDFELTQLGCAIAVFAFLPFAQLMRAHVSVDLFIQALRPGVQRGLDRVVDVLMAGFALLLLWRMSLGFLGYYATDYPEVTPILQIPVWWAFPPILVSLALWAAVAGWMAAGGRPAAGIDDEAAMPGGAGGH
ncbi:TRAP transporter small permease [Tistrella mobilis]|uniref:TRAP transporter small permease n=1 Tax=Tistrella mobilis TaxID=171437 RepID=UPI003557A305